MMVVDNKFDFGQIVYLKTDKEQLPRMVTRFSISQTAILYVLAQGTIETTHYDVEISEEVNVILKTTE